jgi:hypothetical protein
MNRNMEGATRTAKNFCKYSTITICMLTRSLTYVLINLSIVATSNLYGLTFVVVPDVTKFPRPGDAAVIQGGFMWAPTGVLQKLIQVLPVRSFILFCD